MVMDDVMKIKRCNNYKEHAAISPKSNGPIEGGKAKGDYDGQKKLGRMSRRTIGPDDSMVFSHK